VTPAPHRPRLLDPDTLPAAPRQVRSREKRARLLAAGLTLFGERGYEAASVEAIAARAEVAVGSFYQQFRTKRQLLLVLMDQLLEGLEQLDLRPKGAASIREGLRALLQGAFARDLAFAGAYRAWREAILLDSTLAPLQEQIENWTRARVTGVFELLLQLPGARRDVNATILARLMDRLFWDLLGQATRLARGELEAILESTTDLLYHALFFDPARQQNPP
jgi:AcrR family transcriptional regulator